MPSSLFHDTFFGYVLRIVFGSKILPHADEVELPMVWRATIDDKTEKQKEPSIREVARDEEGAPSVHTVVEEMFPSQSTPSLATTIGAQEIQTVEKGSDTLLVGWYGPNDPDNPQNWSSGKKAWVLFQTCFLTFSVYVGSSIYTAGLTDVTEKFHVSTVAATVGLTCFVAGYGIGPMLWAPMSEMPYIGRVPVYILTLVVFVALQVPTALASNFGMLLAFRFLTGFFGSPILATGGATVADMYSPKKRAYGMTLWGLFAALGPVMGPLVGGFAANAKGWTWTIWELTWLSGTALVILFFFFPETSPANILFRRAARLRKATGNPNLKSESEIEAEHMTPRDVAMIALVRPFTLNFQEPIVLALNLYIGLVYALLYIWFESFPLVFIGIYGFRPQILGLSYLGILIGTLGVIPPFFWYLWKYQEPKYNAAGDLRPEERMPVAIVGALILPISLFWFGWSSRESVHWIVPIIGSSLFGFSVMLLFNVVLNYLADTYPLYAASVLAGNDLVRSSFGASFPLFAGAMYRNLGIGWASTLLALLACLFIPIPILLYKYGERIRLASQRARHDFD